MSSETADVAFPPASPLRPPVGWQPSALASATTAIIGLNIARKSFTLQVPSNLQHYVRIVGLRRAVLSVDPREPRPDEDFAVPEIASHACLVVSLGRVVRLGSLARPGEHREVISRRKEAVQRGLEIKVRGTPCRLHSVVGIHLVAIEIKGRVPSGPEGQILAVILQRVVENTN